MSTPPLFFLAHLPDGRSVELNGDEGRHAARAMRLGVGEPVWVGDGCGALLDCVVTTVRTDGLGLEILGRHEVPVPDPWLVVVQAIPKGDRGELAVELMTELGVDEIVPWSATRSIAQWHGERGAKAQLKWQRTAREAAKQSRRARVPVVTEPHTTAAVSTRLAGGASLVLHEAAAETLVDAA
ncbi:MAG: 16S rRNA (uracil(1498)-N(3))-methyltransferase, partial [Actinomycetota bacterium]|nr:16S rRNA (uracil(1498)-N(3))-methyltransferase [Actinomycetota bacterium]